MPAIEIRIISIAAIPAIGIDFWINANGDTYFTNAALAVVALGIAVRVCDFERDITLNRSIRSSWLEVVLSAIAVMCIGSPILSRLPPSLAGQTSLIFGVVVLCGLAAHLVVHSRTNQQLRLRLVTSVVVIASLIPNFDRSAGYEQDSRGDQH